MNLLAALLLASGLSGFAADKLLHPVRWSMADAKKKGTPTSPAEVKLAFEPLELLRPDGVRLVGWRMPARGRPRGILVWVHRLADNRSSVLWIAPRFAQLGFDVVAFDLRAHGESGGAEFTYGFREKEDLVAVVQLAAARPRAKSDAVVLLGSSVGAAIAVQAAPLVDGLKAVVAASPFESLPAMALAARPWYASETSILEALDRAGVKGKFDPRAVAPVAAAAEVKVPLLVLHGAADETIPPAQGERVAKAAPRGRFLLVNDAGHEDLLKRGEPWAEIEKFVLDAVR